MKSAPSHILTLMSGRAPSDVLVARVRELVPDGQVTKFATRMGISMEHLLRLRKGLNSDVKLSTLPKIADALGIHITELISDETKPASPASNTSTEAAPSPPSRASRLDSAGAPAPAAHDQAVGGPEEDPVEVDRRILNEAVGELRSMGVELRGMRVDLNKVMHAVLVLHGEENNDWDHHTERRKGPPDRRHEEERPRPQLEAPGRIERDG